MTQQRDLFTRRWRRPRVVPAMEFQTQISLIDRLKLQCNPAVVYWHTPNGEERDKRTAAKLRAMGVLPGVADLQFIWLGDRSPRVLFLELKRAGEKQSDDQIWFEKLVRERGCDYEVATGIDEAVKVLQRYGILP